MKTKKYNINEDLTVPLPSRVYKRNPFYSDDLVKESQSFIRNKLEAQRSSSIKNSLIYSKPKKVNRIENSSKRGCSDAAILNSPKNIDVDRFMFIWGYDESWRLKITNTLRSDLMSNADKAKLREELKMGPNEVLTNEKVDPAFKWDGLVGTNVKLQGVEIYGENVAQSGSELPPYFINTDRDPKDNTYQQSVVVKAYGLHYSSEWISFFITKRPTNEMRWSRRTFRFNRSQWKQKALGTPNERITYTSRDISGEMAFYGIEIEVPVDIKDPERSSKDARVFDFKGRIMTQALFQTKLEHMIWTITDGQKKIVVASFMNTESQYDKFIKNFPGPGDDGDMWDHLETYDHQTFGIFQKSKNPFIDLIDFATDRIFKYNPNLSRKQYGDPSWALLVPGNIISRVMRDDKNQLHLFTGSNIMGMKHLLEKERRSFYRVRDTNIFDVTKYMPVERANPIQLLECHKQDIIFNYFPIERYKGKPYRYDREGIIYVRDGERRNLRGKVKLSDYITHFRKLFNKTSRGGYGIKTLHDFVGHFADVNPNAYYKNAIDGMYAHILSDYSCKEKSLDEVVSKLKKMAKRDRIKVMFIAFGRNVRGTLPYEVYGDINDKHRYISDSITDLIENVVSLSPEKDQEELIKLKLRLFVSIVGKDTFINLLDKSTLLFKANYMDQISLQDHMPDYLRHFFKNSKLVFDVKTNKVTKETIAKGIKDASTPISILKGVFTKIPFDGTNEDEKGIAIERLRDNNILLPGYPYFLRTVVSSVDSAGLSKKGALELMVSEPYSFIQTDVEKATAIFSTNMACGVAPLDEDGYLRIDHANYNKIKKPPSISFWDGNTEIENRQKFRNYEGLIVPFLLKESEWKNVDGRKVLPVSGQWHKKYRKHAVGERFCMEKCFDNPILNDFHDENKMEYQREYFAYFRHSEFPGMTVTGNRMYQGYQQEFDPDLDDGKGSYLEKWKQMGHLSHIFNYYFKDPAPEMLVRYSQQ